MTATIATPDDNNSYALGKVRVWIMPPIAYIDRAATPPRATYSFPWAWGSWKEDGRLIPVSASKSPGSIGSASFTMLRRTRKEPRDNRAIPYDDNVLEGAYVCITIATEPDGDTIQTPVTNPEIVQWIGYITAVSGEKVRGTNELRGNVQARELGGLLDMQQVSGWRRKRADSGYPETITTPPTANIGTGTSVVIGNAVAVSGIVDGGDGGGYVFARLPADCGTSSSNYWSRDRLMRHMLIACKPNALPRITWNYVQATIHDYQDDVTTPEVFELRNLTYKGALDMLIPQARGIGWYLTANADGWTANLFSYADSTTYGLPANAAHDIGLGATAVDSGTNQAVDSVSFSYNYDTPDEVVIEGNPIVFCGTVSFTGGNLINGWTAAQEASYKAGASLNLDGTSNTATYNPLAVNTKKMLNAAVRESVGLRDVYTRFLVQATTRGTSGDLHITDAPGAPGARGERPFCPEINWNGTTLRFNRTSSASPYLPAARVLRMLPWPEGVKSNGTDTRSAAAKSVPQFRPIHVFRYDPDLTPKWRDQNAENGRPALPSMSVEPDDHGPGVRIRFNPPEILAHGHWGSSSAIADIDPEASGSGPFDWQQLYITLAIEGDQRVRVSKRRQVYGSGGALEDLPESLIRNRVVIPATDLHCWLTHNNTALGMDSKGTPDFLTGTNCIDASDGKTIGYLTRNDFPVAERRARQAAAFLFRSRAAVTISHARFDALPVWCQLGFMIGAVTDPLSDGTSSSITANTVVTSVIFSFGQTPRVTVATDFPTMPAFTPLSAPGLGGGGSSPTAGGSVSVALSGTPAQALSRLAGAPALAMDRDTQRIPVIPQRPPIASPLILLRIIDGQTVYNSGGTTFYGIKKFAGTITTVPSNYVVGTNDTPGTFTATDGIGRAYVVIDGQVSSSMVLVLFDASSPVDVDLVTGDFVQCDTIVTVMGPTLPLTVYMPKFL